jgi:hypothetical protein
VCAHASMATWRMLLRQGWLCVSTPAWSHGARCCGRVGCVCARQHGHMEHDAVSKVGVEVWQVAPLKTGRCWVLSLCCSNTCMQVNSSSSGTRLVSAKHTQLHEYHFWLSTMLLAVYLGQGERFAVGCKRWCGRPAQQAAALRCLEVRHIMSSIYLIY